MKAVEVDASRRVRIVCTVGVVVMVAYWVLWYAARDVIESESTQAYYDFENAFPLADAWLTVCLIGAVVTLRRRSPAALFFLLAGGGAGIYLFCMDALYDIENNIWFGTGGGGLVELLINIVTLTVSVWLLHWAWQRRDALLGIG
jgi:hypothetical protein